MQEETKLLLWRKSRFCLAVIDFQNFKVVKEINNFWGYKTKNVDEVLAICGKKAESILAVSQYREGENLTRVFHHYTKKKNTGSALMNELIPDLNFWYDIAMCFDQKEFFVAGTSTKNKSIGLLFAVLKATMPIKITIAIKVPDLNKAKKVQRITGTDLFLIACEKDFLVSRYNREAEKGKLELVNRIRSVGTDHDIRDFSFKKYFCFSLIENSSKLIILNFQPGKVKSPVKKQVKDTMRISEFMNESFGVNGSLKKEVGTERKEDQIMRESHYISTKRKIENNEVLQEKNTNGEIVGGVIGDPKKMPPLPPRQSSEKKKTISNEKKNDISLTKENSEKHSQPPQKPYLKRKRNIQRVKVSTSYEKSPRKNPNGSSKKRLPELKAAESNQEPNKDTQIKEEAPLSATSNSFKNTQESISLSSIERSTGRKKKKITRQKTSVTVTKVQKGEITQPIQQQPKNNNFSLWKNNKNESGQTGTERILSNQMTPPNISEDTVQSRKSVQSHHQSSIYNSEKTIGNRGEKTSGVMKEETRDSSKGSDFGYREKVRLREVNSESRPVEESNGGVSRKTTGMVEMGGEGIPVKKIGKNFDSLEFKNPDDLISGLNVAPSNTRMTQQYSLKTFSQNTIMSNSSNSDLIGGRDGDFRHVNDSQFVHGHGKRKITEIAIPKNHCSNLTRICISDDEKYFYLGGENLHFLKKIENQDNTTSYALLKNKILKLSIYNMIPTPSGHILAFEARTNDAILISPTFEKMKRLNGIPDSEFLPPDAFLQCRKNYCNRITNEIVWINSQISLKLIKMNDLSMKDITIFNDETYIEENDPYILHAVYTSRNEVVISCFLGEDLAIAYQKCESLETNIYLMKHFSPHFGFIGGIDLSKDEKVLFVAGSTNFIEELELEDRGEALISAMKVGEGMEEIVCQNLGNELGGVLCIKQYSKFPNSLFLGCFSGIVELTFNGKAFEVLNYVKISQKDIIIDFHICSNYPEELFYLTKRAPSKVRNVRIIK